MKIIESDCYIECVNGIFQLYLLKNKKELKENSEDTYKIGGYFTDLDSSFKEVVKFRQHKKYPFKEDWRQVKTLLNNYLNQKKSLKKQLQSIYSPIQILKKELFNYE